MENSHYPYMIHQKQPKHHGIWNEEEGPTTSQLEVEPVLSVSCNVCRKTFRSKKALWGHRRCCKAARADYQNENCCVSGYKHDMLESGWCMTDKRGRKPVISITSPEYLAADILMYMSGRENGSVVSIQGNEKKIAEIEEPHQIDDSPMISISCGNKFVCFTCGKIFSSYESLRGHKASQGKDESMVNSVSKFEKQVKHKKGLIRGNPRCDVCGESFPSGQALGGHKRKHWTGPSFMTGNRSRASEVDASMFPATGVTCMHAFG